MSDFDWGWRGYELYADPHPPLVSVAPALIAAEKFGEGQPRWLIVSPDVAEKAREAFASDPLMTVRVQDNLVAGSWYLCDRDGEIVKRDETEGS